MSHLQPRLVRQRHVPRLMSGVAGAAYRRELEEYLDVHHRLYRAVSDVSGADVVVDASKSTAQLFALRRIQGLDLRVVNLVRDSRGVANSWNKSGIVKPQSTDGALMGTYAPHRLAVLWAALQLECAVLGAATPYAARVRYEDLVARPRPTLERTLSDVGLPPAEGALAHVGERSVILDPSHGVAGSRTRFAAGRIELQVDDAWRSTLPAGARRVVTAVTLPQLVGYGYVGLRPHASTGQGRVMSLTSGALLTRPPSPARPGPRYLKPGWPLAVLFLGFPVWWALGLAQLIFFAVAAAMAVILRRQGSLRVPRGFALWLLFLVWMLAGVFLVRANAPGTVPSGGLGQLGGFTVWAGWYVAITIAMLYVANTARQVPTQRIVRLLGWMFVVTTGFGVLAMLAPTLEFKSPMELVLPERTGVEELRPHAGPPLAVVFERLPRVRAAAPDGAVPLLERVGQQHGPLPAVLRLGVVRA